MIARHVSSRPMKSASVSGPIGWFMPGFIAAVSIASIDATLFVHRAVKIASLIIGIRMRLAMKPGKSRTSTGVLPSDAASSTIARAVESLVAIPRITSTSCITGTGFMKCIPIDAFGFAGRRTRAR